jgi:hypothetical protein
MDKCPKCGSEVEQGYGLAFGGIGAYSYCTNEECDWFDKVQDPEMERTSPPPGAAERKP